MKTRIINREVNGWLAKVAIIICGGLGIAGTLALVGTVNAADVSRQIKTESPYVPDRAVLMRALDKELPALRSKQEEMNRELGEQRVILERIDRKLNRGE